MPITPATYSAQLETALRAHHLLVRVGSTWEISNGNCKKVRYQPGEPSILFVENLAERSIHIGTQSVGYVAGVIVGLLEKVTNG